MARHASYADLADIIRQRFDNPRGALRELVRPSRVQHPLRQCLRPRPQPCGLLDGARLSLTPAYGICLQSRTGTEANQATNIFATRHESLLRRCLEAAVTFLLTPAEAETLIRGQVAVIRQGFDAVSDEAGLSEADRALLRSRQFLNPCAFGGLPEEY